MGISNPEGHGPDRPGPSDIWRTWLVTGARAHPIDRRRLQGEHRGLKQILAEGGEAGVQRRPWRDFSRAMVRQSVNEAMSSLPPEERVVVRFAYFVGFTNQEIAEELGMTARGVQRELRLALDHLSDLMERGKRAALALLVILSGRRIVQSLGALSSPAATHVLAVAVVIGGLASVPAVDAAATAPRATSVAVQQAPPAQAAPPAQPAQATQPPPGPATTAAAPAALAVVSQVKVPAAPAITAPAVPTVTLPVTIPKLRIKHALPGKVL